jgi:NADH-quinone oxidoreductase subunit G
MFGDEIQRKLPEEMNTTVDEFICNGCRFDHKEVADWVLKDQEHLKKIRLSSKINTRKKKE